VTERPPGAPLLREINWQTSYRHDDGDLVELFYVRALACAATYDRTTGFFTADALALAARGLERLIANRGRMRLIVGCTLGPEEVAAIREGYDRRAKIAEVLGALTLVPPDLKARNGLEALAWMIEHGRLDIRVALPVDPATRLPVVAPGIYHEKVGVITDFDGNRLSFSGSINETQGGWVNNRESFHVHCSWLGEREAWHVRDEVNAFEALWEDRARSVQTLDFPEAARARLLEFLPRDDRFVAPTPAPRIGEEDGQAPEQGRAHEEGALLPEELRRLAWALIRNAARMPNGIRVGEVTSTVNPWPHQLRTFKRMIEQWPFRMLLCDEVGLGKTITAGLVLRQLWLAGKARRILLLVPKAVIRQWQNELYEKFNLNVLWYDGRKLIWRTAHWRRGSSEQVVGRNEWHKQPLVLASSQLMRRRNRRRELLRCDPWDLVLLDEAHHARRKGAGSAREQGPNLLLSLMQELKDRTQGLLLLTATPMQVAPVEVWDLVNLLGLPPEWDAPSFVRYFELAAGNPDHEELCWLARMFQATEAQFGLLSEAELEMLLPGVSRMRRRKIVDALRDVSGIPLRMLSAEHRRGALELLRKASPLRWRMARSTRNLLRRYFHEGLLDKPVPAREVKDRKIQLSAAERELYEAVEAYISDTYNAAAPDRRNAVGFLMTIYRRRLASSFHALRMTLTNRLGNLNGMDVEEDLDQDELLDDPPGTEEASALMQTAAAVEETDRIHRLLKRIAMLGDADTKARCLLQELHAAMADGYESAIIFTQYTDTLDYLKDYLSTHLPELTMATYSGRGGELRESTGEWKSCSRDRVKRELRQKKIRLLLCTDAAGEGLNLQYCGVLVNYDLPWNPMKVEQRIGRIDRIGQEREVIRIVNLAYEDTVEADIYFSLGNRINLFQGIVGKLQPILSRLPEQFERVALARRDRREEVRQQMLAGVELERQAAEAGTFDIDVVAPEELVAPEFPEPPLTMDQLDKALNLEALRPADWEWRPLDHRSYSLRAPGMAEPIRVTTSPEVFDEHFESHVFLSPGSEILGEVDEVNDIRTLSTKGFTVEVEPDGGWRIWAEQEGARQEVNSLQDLLACADAVSG